MPPTTIRAPPVLDSFTSLAEHQAQTPATFYDAKPVLHYHASRVRALVSRDRLSQLPIFAGSTNGDTANGQAAGEGSAEGVSVQLVEAFISSENFTLFNKVTSTGISIPYPTISLHAIQRLDDPANPSEQVQGLYMQLEMSDPNAMSEEDEEGAIELTLVPPPESEIKTLFEAVSNCSNLHPDVAAQDDEEMEDGDGDSRIVFEGNVGYEGIGGLPGVSRGVADGTLPPPFPGSGGWITAENVSEYFDEEGNWIRDDVETGETLGEGAGRTRTRDEMNGDGMNGHGDHASDDNKRSRTG